MKKEIKMKKSFTIVEMLFVMFLIALLSAIAIPTLFSQTKMSIVQTMKSDANGIRHLCNIYYQNHFNYNGFEDFKNNHKFEDTDDDGRADKGGIDNDGKIDGYYVNLSKDNVAIIYPKKCNSDDQDYSGYTIEITNPNVDQDIYFDSCTDSSPHLK